MKNYIAFLDTLLFHMDIILAAHFKTEKKKRKYN